MEDLALFTGGQIVGKERQKALETVTIDDLGGAKKAIISPIETNIFNGGGEQTLIDDYVSNLKAQILQSPDSERQALQEHIGRFTRGIAVVKIGGVIKFEMMDKKYKAESALNSANSALEEGSVLGGGLTLFLISRAVKTLTAMEDPIHRLIENSQVNLAQILSEISESPNASVGFNAVTRRIGDLSKAGILDSTKGLRIALEIAFSHTKAVLQTIEWDLRQSDEPGIHPPTPQTSIE
jgi:chaperonin GroEL